MSLTRIHPPYLLFLGHTKEPLALKTARGLCHWRREQCVGQLRFEDEDGHLALGLELPDLTPEQAVLQGARTLVVGCVNAGGFIPESWVDALVTAAQAGLDLASGLHTRLAEVESIRRAAAASGVRMIEAREPGRDFPVGDGTPRSGKRLLTVGTDCNVGKMFTSLAIEREMKGRGIEATFRATGQTGILIAGEGVPVDAVVSDFISGSVEVLCPAIPEDQWQIIEGQGALHHPGFAGVTLGLIHGAQPDWLVLCHEPTRPHVRHAPAIPVPSLQVALDAALEAARLTNPDVRCAGVSVNTMFVDEGEVEGCLARCEDEVGLPATDPVRLGVSRLVDVILGTPGKHG